MRAIGIVAVLFLSSCITDQQSIKWTEPRTEDDNAVLERFAAGVEKAYRDAAYLAFDVELTRTWTKQDGAPASHTYHGSVLMTGGPEEEQHTIIRNSNGAVIADILVRGNTEENDMCLYGVFTTQTWLGQKGDPRRFAEWIRKGSLVEDTEVVNGIECAVFSHTREFASALDYYRRVDTLYVSRRNIVVRWVFREYEKPDGRPMTAIHDYKNIMTSPRNPGPETAHREGEQR